MLLLLLLVVFESEVVDIVDIAVGLLLFMPKMDVQ